MKYQIMLGILFTLLGGGKIPAALLAKKYDCSTRTIYRYLDEMTIAGIPIDIARGPNGGVYISDAYKLPRGFFTKEEYGKTVDALLTAYEQLPSEPLRSAISKLKAQIKAEKFDLSLSGNILVDGGAWGDEHKFSDKLALLEKAIEEREALAIDYYSRGGEHTKREIKPLLLVYKQNIWYLYAYCELRKDFRLFKAGRIRTVLHTGKTFEPIAFSRADVPLSFWVNESTVDARFAVSPEALLFVEEWVGVENVTGNKESGYIVNVTLPDDEALIGTILSAGAGLKVIYPESLKERVKDELRKISEAYEKSAN